MIGNDEHGLLMMRMAAAHGLLSIVYYTCVVHA